MKSAIENKIKAAFTYIQQNDYAMARHIAWKAHGDLESQRYNISKNDYAVLDSSVDELLAITS